MKSELDGLKREVRLRQGSEEQMKQVNALSQISYLSNSIIDFLLHSFNWRVLEFIVVL